MKVAVPKLLEEMCDKASFLMTLFFGPVILAYLMILWLIFMLLLKDTKTILDAFTTAFPNVKFILLMPPAFDD